MSNYLQHRHYRSIFVTAPYNVKQPNKKQEAQYDSIDLDGLSIDGLVDELTKIKNTGKDIIKLYGSDYDGFCNLNYSYRETPEEAKVRYIKEKKTHRAYEKELKAAYELLESLYNKKHNKVKDKE